jgi:hypothetical protein
VGAFAPVSRRYAAAVEPDGEPMPPPVPEDASGLLGGGELAGDVSLDRWAADARADEAAAARSRERWLAQQAVEEATFAGTLVALAERVDRVVLLLAGGGRRTGVVSAVGDDFCELRDRGRIVLVALDAIASVQPHEQRGPATGSSAPGDRRLLGALALHCGDRPRVQVVTRGGESVGGILVAVGEDVITVEVDGARGVVYIRAGAVAEAVVER